MSRPKGETKLKWKISLPVAIAAQVDIILHDPTIGDVPIGRRSQLVTRLLREWVEKKRVDEIDNQRRRQQNGNAGCTTPQ
jgi:hypothetical protein